MDKNIDDILIEYIDSGEAKIQRNEFYCVCRFKDYTKLKNASDRIKMFNIKHEVFLSLKEKIILILDPQILKFLKSKIKLIKIKESDIYIYYSNNESDKFYYNKDTLEFYFSRNIYDHLKSKFGMGNNDIRIIISWYIQKFENIAVSDSFVDR
jgi:hypothetical protein